MSIKTKRGPIINWLIKSKIAKNVLGANVILLVVSAVSLTVAFRVDAPYFVNRHEEITYLEDISPEIRKTLPPEVLKTIPSRVHRERGAY